MTLADARVALFGGRASVVDLLAELDQLEAALAAGVQDTPPPAPPTLPTLVDDPGQYLTAPLPLPGMAILDATPDTLGAVLARATGPGQAVRLAPGVYTGSHTLGAAGTPERPIAVLGQPGAVYSGRLQLVGACAAVEGLEVAGPGRIELLGPRQRVRDCRLRDTPVAVAMPVILIGGPRALVEACELARLGGMGIRHASLADGGAGLRSWTRLCLFRDADSRRTNGTEAYQVGQSESDTGPAGDTSRDYGCVLEHSVFQNCAASDDETASLKGSGNRVGWVRLDGSRRIEVRAGNRNLLVGNLLQRSSGIWVAGRDNALVGNDATDTQRGILVQAGSVLPAGWPWPSPKPAGGYLPRAEGTMMVGNRGAVTVGDHGYRTATQACPAVGTVILAHDGPVGVVPGWADGPLGSPLCPWPVPPAPPFRPLEAAWVGVGAWRAWA